MRLLCPFASEGSRGAEGWSPGGGGWAMGCGLLCGVGGGGDWRGFFSCYI